MKCKKLIAILLIVMVILCIGFFIWKSNHDLFFRPHEELVYSCNSCSNRYLIEIYKNSGNATVANSITGDVTDNKTGKKRTFYFSYREEEAIIEWIDDSHCIINGVTINLAKDIYESWNY